MKGMKLKIFVTLVFSMLCFSSVLASNEYKTQEIFEVSEWAICQSATDGCNTFFLNNWKVTGGTLKYCASHTPTWSCLKYNDGIKVYETQGEFEKAEWAICQNATDGCNSYFMNNWKVGGGTLMACQWMENPLWRCTNYIEWEKTYSTQAELEKAEWAICKSATDRCNSYVFGTDWKVGAGTAMLCFDHTPSWKCTSYKDIVKKDEVKKYSSVSEFEKAEWLTCESATDGCNTFFMNKWKVGGWTLMACPNHKVEWSCKKRDDMIYALDKADLADYLVIKAGKLSTESIILIEDYTEKFMLMMSKMVNFIKVNRIESVVSNIEWRITKLEKERYSRVLETKINILKLLKFNLIKEAYLIKEQTNWLKMHPSWDLNKDWLNDCEDDGTCDDSVDYTLPRTFEYTCNENKTMYISIDKDVLTLNDNFTKRFYYLDRVISADGEKFEDVNNLVWLKWNDLIFQRGGVDFYKWCTRK